MITDLDIHSMVMTTWVTKIEDLRITTVVGYLVLAVHINHESLKQ